jgi:hypothetical protein
MANLKTSGNTPSAYERLASVPIINSAKTTGHAFRRPIGTKLTDEPAGFSSAQ